MADRIADNADLLLDETKRKARRRLVGAVVLALAAAIILPMLLEKEPRPLGDDVSVRIPPVDESKFINRLTGKSGDTKPLPKADDKAEPKSAVAKTGPKSESTADPAAQPAPASAMPAASDASAPKKATADEARPITSVPAASTTTDAKSAPKEVIAETKPAAPVETKPAAAESKPAPAEPKPTAAEAKPAMATAPASAVVPAKPEGFVVQLAAFADDKGANSLANKLKKAGYAAFVESVQTSRGTLWRVRVGGYGTRPEADAARVKLKAEGFSGIVAPAS